MKFSPILFALVALGCFGCAPKNAQEAKRSHIEEMNGITGQAAISPLAASLDAPNMPRACERLKELEREQLNVKGPAFRYFHSLYRKENAWQGALEIEDSPFVQLFFGEKFVVDSNDGFLERAKKEHAAGHIGGMKFFFVRMMHAIGATKMVQVPATNSKLEEAFPGVFGLPGPVETSLHWKLASRAANDAIHADDTSILTARIPLFANAENWDAYAEGTRLSLAAAINSFRKEDSGRERLCGLVLLHQNFAQLLTLKGYEAAKVQAPFRRNYPSRIEKLGITAPEFEKVAKPGAFFDLQSRKPVVLENEQIKAYDPRKPLAISAAIPDGSPSAPGTFSDSLALMESLLYGFEASSPAAPWADKYLFGDVEGETGSAVLPAEVHALTLGLMTMHFKSLAALHLRKVTSKGKNIGANELAAGVVIAHDLSGNTVRVKAEDVARLAKVVAYFHVALKRFAARNPEEWVAQNPLYDRKTLALLLGGQLFSEAELAKLLSPEERASVLIDNLQALKFPLALLMTSLINNGCVAEMDWNLSTGVRKPVAMCSLDQRLQLADALELLGRDGKSKTFLDRAAELRNNL